jgi:O-antigen ligase
VAALVGVGVLALVVPPLRELTFDRLGPVIESGGTGRLDIWTIALNVWGHSPFVGVGYGAFPAAMTLEIVRATDVPTLDIGVLTPPIGSHSIVIGTVVELGLAGGAALAAFVWHVMRPRAVGEIATVARLALLAMLTQGLFLDVLGRKQVWLFIALVAGLSAASVLAGRRAKAAGRDEPELQAGRGSRPVAAPGAPDLPRTRART